MNKLIVSLLLILSVMSGNVEAKELPKIMYEVHEATTLIAENQYMDSHVIVVPDASFVKVHFSKFQIPNGVIIRVRNKAGTEVYDYSKHSKGPHTKHGSDDGVKSFSAMSITGDTAIVEVIGYNPSVKSVLNRLDIDYYSAGLPQEEIDVLYDDFRMEESASTESTCGLVDNKVPTPCIIDTYPTEYERMRPVARITNGGGSLCTAWRVGPDNKLFTNNHCNGTQAEIAASEVWFNYEYTNCAGTSRTPTDQIVKVSGATLLETSYTYDMTLFTVNNFELTERFGYFGLEIRPPVLGELIYRGGHGSGRPKLATIESDIDDNGMCQINLATRGGRGPETDTAYWCDSIGGSSGSPVLLRENGRAIALHHYGGCMNAGVKMSGIWPLVASQFNNVIPNGDDDPGVARISPNADIQVDCTFGVCNFDASGSSDPDGTVESYAWDFGDGTTADTATGVKTYDKTGVYIVKLLIKDNDNNTGYAAVNLPVTLEGTTITPDAEFSYTDDGNYTGYFVSESFDWDGEIVKTEWRVRDTGVYTPASSAGDWFVGDTFEWTFQIGGKHIVWVRVTDDFGADATSGEWITINGPIMNEDPVAGFTVQAVNNYDTWKFTDTSTDDSEIVSWSYNWKDGSTAGREPTMTHKFILPDGVTEMQVRPYLYVTDNHGVTDVFHGPTLTVTTPPVNQAPVADFSYEAELVTVTFTDTSTDDRNEIVAWAWDFGDENTSTETNPVHVYPATLADYDVTLEVTDGEGLTDATTLSVHVDPVPANVIALRFTSAKARKGKMNLRLIWSGTPTDYVEIFREGRLLGTYVNDGSEIFSVKRNEKNKAYKVCEVNTDPQRQNACSDTVRISF